MAQINWRATWQETSVSPYARAVLVLMALNGLTAHQIRDLRVNDIALDTGWITTADGQVYALVTQAADALTALPQATDQLFLTPEAEIALQQFKVIEAEAHRRLSGAIWYTSDEGKLLTEIGGMSEAPILPLRFMFPFSITERLHGDENSEIAAYSRQVLQTAANWLFQDSFAIQQSLPSRLIASLKQGRTIFLLVSMGVSGLNLLHNIVMGRLLTPADYGQLALLITLALFISLLSSAIQTVVARFSARYFARGEIDWLVALQQLGRQLTRQLNVIILVVGLLLSPLLTSFFQLRDVGLLLPVIIGLPFMIALGVDRGLLQGLDSFWWLSAAYLSEGTIRLGIGLLLGLALREAGRGLDGAVWGFAQSMLVSWLISWVAVRHFRPAEVAVSSATQEERNAWTKLAVMTMIALVGQALITNSDFLLVKNYFTPAEAGLYAAVSVMGRIVYFGALPLTIVLIPLIARRQALNEPTQPIFVLLMAGGAMACGLLLVIAWLFAADVLRLLFGEPYVPGAALLPAYTLAASLYTLTNLMLSYRIALGRGSETWMPLLAGVVQIVAILLFHDTLQQVILIQIILMGLLLAGVFAQIVRSNLSQKFLAANSTV